MQLPVIIKEKEAIVKIGSSELTFRQGSTPDPFYHFAINIPGNKIEEAKAWLSGRVGLIWMDEYQSEVADFVNWNAKSVYFFDPAGNIVELIARFDLHNETDNPFSSMQFLSISEVALVFQQDEMENGTKALLEEFQLRYFDKQPPLPHFKAIGDDEGLFIIVPEYRNWYPTDLPSWRFPMEIEFEDAGRMYELFIPGLK